MSREAVNAALAAHAASSGSSGADLVSRLIPLVYDELRAIARRHLGRDSARRVLDTTALVHEAYLHLVDHPQVSSRGRHYFFGAAARAMRQILVDTARSRGRAKRGGGAPSVPLDETLVGVDGIAVEVLDLDGALNKLAVEFPRQARVVECRFFVGLSIDETAEALDVSARTVKGDWAFARAWLFKELKDSLEQ